MIDANEWFGDASRSHLFGDAPRAYKGGALNTVDPLRVRVVVEYHTPPSHTRVNLGFRCFRTVCTPRLHQ